MISSPPLFSLRSVPCKTTNPPPPGDLTKLPQALTPLVEQPQSASGAERAGQRPLAEAAVSGARSAAPCQHQGLHQLVQLRHRSGGLQARRQQHLLHAHRGNPFATIDLIAADIRTRTRSMYTQNFLDVAHHTYSEVTPYLSFLIIHYYQQKFTLITVIILNIPIKSTLLSSFYIYHLFIHLYSNNHKPQQQSTHLHSSTHHTLHFNSQIQLHLYYSLLIKYKLNLPFYPFFIN